MQRQGVPPWLRIWAILMLSPVPVLLLVSQRPLLGQMLIAVFVVTALIVGTVKPLSRAAPAV
jgi:hypothetical protein